MAISSRTAITVGAVLMLIAAAAMLLNRLQDGLTIREAIYPVLFTCMGISLLRLARRDKKANDSDTTDKTA